MENLVRWLGWGEYAYALLELIRDDVCAVRPQLDEVRAAVRDMPFAGVSRVRLLESLIWYYFAGR